MFCVPPALTAAEACEVQNSSPSSDEPHGFRFLGGGT